jgi:hypothetical protein
MKSWRLDWPVEATRPALSGVALAGAAAGAADGDALGAAAVRNWAKKKEWEGENTSQRRGKEGQSELKREIRENSIGSAISHGNIGNRR